MPIWVALWEGHLNFLPGNDVLEAHMVSCLEPEESSVDSFSGRQSHTASERPWESFTFPARPIVWPSNSCIV